MRPVHRCLVPLPTLGGDTGGGDQALLSKYYSPPLAGEHLLVEYGAVRAEEGDRDQSLGIVWVLQSQS